MTKQLPLSFPSEMTGLELINQWGAVAHEAGFVWPDDWQHKCKDCECWEAVLCTAIRDWNYRINPGRLKPKAKRLTVLTGDPYLAYDEDVRRRLSEDAGVDWRKVSEICMKIQLYELDAQDAPEKIMQLIADAAVEVNDD